MSHLPSRRVVDASHRAVGIVLAERPAHGTGTPLYDILLCPPEGIQAAIDGTHLEGAVRATVAGRSRFRRPASRLEILETAEARFGSGLEEEELLFLLAYHHRAPIPYERALATLLATPSDVEANGDVLVLKAPWRDFLTEASQELPPGVAGVFVAGLTEGWTTVEAKPLATGAGGLCQSTRFTILAPAMVEVEFPGYLPVQEGDHVLVRGPVQPNPAAASSERAPWRIPAEELIIPARKGHYLRRN